MENIKDNINRVSKPGYKYTKLGWIPDDWEIVSIDDLCNKIVNGGTPTTKNDNYWKGSIPWISGADIVNQKINTVRRFITSEAVKNSSTNIVLTGNLLVVTRTGVGKLAIAPFDIAISQDLTGLYPKCEKIHIKYLFYHLYYSIPKLAMLNQGTSINGITRETLIKHNIKLPPLIEQQKIAQILSTWDKAIEKTEQLIRAKTQLKKGLMQQLLTGKKRFKEFVISHDYVITRVGLIPKDWIVIPFSEVADKKVKWSLTGGPFGSNLKAEDFTEEGVRIVQLQNIGDGEFYNDYKIFTSDEKADELLSCNIFPGDIILSKMGDPVARACFIPKTRERFLMASDGIRLVPDKQLFDDLFVKEYINYKAFRRAAIRASTGSTRQRIGLTDLKELPFIKLKLKEQQKISSMLSVANEEINLLKSQLKKLISQKKGLMQKLLTGEVRVKT